ncbi:uncharacterized protein LOC122369968 isoform X2 [Amphibalanus amphitrite]|uniref:uncharacterized protein LOC122369968 isoform X2 n=1 Tax=Amphibalanus amphitrite TaxID=1232801 RepID=UPI001C924B06|nr:uncharacterized protein LOC122369968 isoform X2 [Amphibalanus amphitrite]
MCNTGSGSDHVARMPAAATTVRRRTSLWRWTRRPVGDRRCRGLLQVAMATNLSRTSGSERQSVLGCEDAPFESSDGDAPCDSVRFPGEFVALCAGRARDWYHPSFHQFSVLQRAVRDLSAAVKETVRRELPPEDLPALTRLEPLADGALSLRPPTLRRPRREDPAAAAAVHSLIYLA